MRASQRLSPINVAFWSFIVIYLAAVLYVRHLTYLDPGSWFFNHKLAYTRQYSEVRRQQADEYIRAATKKTFPALLRNSAKSPDLCVGVAGLLEGPARYLETNIGSLLENLTGNERDRIHLSVFLVHRESNEPTGLPEHFQPWMSKLVDNVQLYRLSNLTAEASTQKASNQYARPYYTDLMKSCYATGAPYMAIFEDEVVAMDGWFHRTMNAIDQAQALSDRHGRPSHDFKINLFYPEVFYPRLHPEVAMHTYLLSSTAVMIAFAAALFTIRMLSNHLKPHLTIKVILTVCCICIPAVITLAISAGWSIYQPLPMGVNQLENYYDNTQGYVFPRQLAKKIIEWNHDGHALRASDVVNGRDNELTWTLNPSVVQHVGRHSLKGEYFEPANEQDRAIAEEMFNFAFELNDADELRREHSKATEQELG